jgi:hypothetical protein
LTRRLARLSSPRHDHHRAGGVDGCWFFDNFGVGDPIVVTNSVGLYTQNDGAQDWQI